MRIALVTIILLAQLLWLIRPLLPYLEYGLNREYIAEVLCINKERPELQCHGQCHLKAMIEQQQEEETPGQGVMPIAPQWESLMMALQPAPASWLPFLIQPCRGEIHAGLGMVWQAAPPTPPPRMV